MTKRIYKIEKFIPRTGNPVFQINEELDIDGKVIQLDPRNPTAQELTDADEVFAVAQQARITELEAIKATLEKEKAIAITERDAATQAVETWNAEKASLTTNLATAKANLTTAQVERNSAKQEVADIYDLLGADPKIAAIKKQQAIAKVESEIAEAIKRKDDLVNPKAVDASVEAYRAPE